MEMQTTGQEFHPLAENDLAQKILQIRKRSSSLMLDIKVASINAVYQSVEHGRTNYANDLINAVPKYMQKQLLQFFQQYGRIQQVKDEQTKTKALVYNKDRKDIPKPEEGKATEYVATIDKAWTEAKAHRVEKPIDIFNPVLQCDKFIAGLHRQLKKVVDTKNAGKDVEEIHSEFVKDLEHFIGQWKVEHGLVPAELETESEEDVIVRADSLEKENEKLRKQLEALQASTSKGSRQGIRKAA